MPQANDVTQWMVDQLVNPSQQYRDAVDAPLDNVRMAWPFKTEEELKAFSKWYKQHRSRLKKKELDEAGDAML